MKIALRRTASKEIYINIEVWNITLWQAERLENLTLEMDVWIEYDTFVLGVVAWKKWNSIRELQCSTLKGITIVLRIYIIKMWQRLHHWSRVNMSNYYADSDHVERKVPKYENHKLKERKMKTLTRNWRDHERDRYTQTHGNWIEILRLARLSSLIERE